MHEPMVTKICMSHYIPDTYHNATFHYDVMRGFCCAFWGPENKILHFGHIF